MPNLERRKLLKTTGLLAVVAALPVSATITKSPKPVKNDPIKGHAEYQGHDATSLAAMVKNGDADPLELLDLAIKRSEVVNPVINAVVIEHFELARQAIKAGLPRGALAGVPFLLKDLGVTLKGTITTGGSRLYRDKVYANDSELVARYKKAGLVVFGKTHSPEFGGTPSSESALYGTTKNPWDLSRSAGGSSGGSAAAVAAGIVPAAHGNDGGGSIRIPASSCGLFGMKPTRGRVPMGPGKYESRDGCSVQHAVTRSVRDSALLLDFTQGSDVGDPYGYPNYARPYTEEIRREPGKLRIALMTDPVIPVPVDTECIQAVDAAAKLCEALGHHVEVAKPLIDLASVYGGFGIAGYIITAQTVAAREAELGRSAREDELEAITRDWLASGRMITGLQHAEARKAMHGASHTLGAFMQNYDLILSPAMAHLPPKLGELSLQQSMKSFVPPASSASAYTALYNITGQPAMSVPLHWSAEGLPVGVMFAGRFGDEATLFRLAAQLEAVKPWFDRRPNV